MNDQEEPVWQRIRREAVESIQHEPMLASFFHSIILNHRTLEDALSFHLANQLGSVTVPSLTMRGLIDEAFLKDPSIGAAFREDIEAFYDRDPACRQFLQPMLYFKGFQAIQSYRVAHYYWLQGRKELALFLQSRISEVFTVDIHPAARIGKAFFMDHATAVVIGETALVEDNVSISHEVTLGGTGIASGVRHPQVRKGVLIAAGAKILGSVEIDRVFSPRSR